MSYSQPQYLADQYHPDSYNGEQNRYHGNQQTSVPPTSNTQHVQPGYLPYHNPYGGQSLPPPPPPQTLESSYTDTPPASVPADYQNTHPQNYYSNHQPLVSYAGSVNVPANLVAVNYSYGYQTELIQRLAAVNIANSYDGASQYGNDRQPENSAQAAQHSIATDPPNAIDQWPPSTQPESLPQDQGQQRGLTSTIAGGTVGVYSVHKIHQRWSGHSAAAQPQGDLHGQTQGFSTVSSRIRPSQWPLYLYKGSTITFDFMADGVEKDKKMGKVFSYILVEPGTARSRPYYTSTFVKDKRFGKHPGLRIQRCKDRDPSKTSRICQCTYRSGGEKVEIWHEWTEWDKWQPQTEPWLSDVGTLTGEEFQWVYNWVGLPAVDDKAKHILRCQYKDDEKKEVCRVTMYQDEQGKIEIPADIIKSQEGLDEMVSSACIQIHRKRMGWETDLAEPGYRAAILNGFLEGIASGGN